MMCSNDLLRLKKSNFYGRYLLPPDFNSRPDLNCREHSPLKQPHPDTFRQGKVRLRFPSHPLRKGVKLLPVSRPRCAEERDPESPVLQDFGTPAKIAVEFAVHRSPLAVLLHVDLESRR